MAMKRGSRLKKSMTVFTASVMLMGMFAVLPMATQNAFGYTTPGMGMMLTFEDLVMMSGGAVTGGMGIYQVNETITIAPTDTLTVNPGLIIQMKPGMNIAIEVLGTLDGMMGMGTLFHSGGPGTWRGIWVHDSGALNANGFMVMDAVNAIYIDHSMGFGMVQINGCQLIDSVGTGLTMIGTMGGPMVGNNMVTGGQTGISLRDTSAQCMMNEVMNCGVGIRVEGWASPWISGNTIHDNSQNAIYGEDTFFGISGNTIRDNREDAIVLFNSTANIDGNSIYAWNATAWSYQSGRNGVRIAGAVEWGQNWISNNRIFGGNGDCGGGGGHAIYIEDFIGNMANQPQIENTIIENNFILQGGHGGNNFDDWGTAGEGGHGIYSPRLSDDGNWSADNHALIVRGNSLIAGGMGGMDNAPMFGTAGNGGHGICVRDDNNAGSMLSTGNLLVVGGGGGGRMSPGLCGYGGNGLCIGDCDSGVRIDIRNHPDVVGGMGGPGPTGMGQGGASMRFERCDSFHILNVSGRSAWTFGEIEDCDGDFDLRGIRISDSDANSGNLVRATGSSSTGNNENWRFDGKNGVSGVIAKDCGRLKLRVANATTSNATGFRFDNCTDLSLDRITVTVRDGTGMEILACTNVTLTNATLNGSRESPVLEKSVIQVIGGDRVGIGPVAVAYGNNRFAVANRNARSVTLIDAMNVNFMNSIVVSENCGGIAFGNDRFAVVNNCRLVVTNGTGLAINDCLNLDLVSLNLSGTGSADPMTPCDGIEAYRWETGNATWLNGTGFRDSGLNLTECSNITVKDFEWTWGDWSECKKPCIGGNRTRRASVNRANITSVNMTVIDLENCTEFNITKSTFKTANGTGLKAANVEGLVVMESFFDIYSENETANYTGMDIFNLTGGVFRNNTVKAKNATAQKIVGFENVSIWGDEFDADPMEYPSSPVSQGAVLWENGKNLTAANTNITVRNGTGISATNISGLKVIGVGLENVPHPKYNGHGTRFKAIARGGCSGTYFRWNTSNNGTLRSVVIDSSHNFTFANNSVNCTGGGGVLVNNSRDCILRGNNIQGNTEGIRLANSQINSVFHNNFLGNAIQASDDTGLNSWDNGYPSGGNYWSDYIGPDVMQGPLQNVPGADWIGDIPYSAIAGGTGTQDTYPLAKPTIDGRVQHMPFRINSNADFDWEHGVVNWATGDGSEGNPWVIENWDVNGTGSIMGGYPACIYVGNTTQHFTIGNCALHEARDSGIELHNVTGGLVVNNDVCDVWWGNGMGIFIHSSNNGTVEGNFVHGQRNHGMLLDISRNINVISNNVCVNLHSGILMINSQFNNIDRNSFSSNDDTIMLIGSYANILKYNMIYNSSNAGLYLTNSDDNLIKDNAVSNTWCGLLLFSSKNNTISVNQFDSNRDYGLMLMSNSDNNAAIENVLANSCTGIEISDSHFNAIYHNIICGNLFQANDSTGTNLWDNGYPSGGNYWSDYIGPDLMSGPLQNIPGPDGIGDVPYMNIQGGTGAVDQYPLMAPWAPEPASFFNISLGVGWNLISIPLDLEDTSIANVLASISGKYDSVKAYDALDPMDPWKSYRQNGTANDLVAIDNTVGVWLHATEACTLTVTGYLPASTAIMLHAGWNLVGYPTLMPMPAMNALAGTNFDGLECWDAASPTLLRAMDPPEMMMPGAGYWIHVPADVIWMIDW